MTELTDLVRFCGLCDCEHRTTAISYKEAQAAIAVVKQEIIEAIEKKIFKYPNHNEARIRNVIFFIEFISVLFQVFN